MQQHTQFHGASASGLAERDGHWRRLGARRWGSASSAHGSHGSHGAFDSRAPGAARSLAATPTLLEATPTFITVRARARASRASAHERGAVLVEFALIVIAFYLLFAGTFEIGRMVFSAQILQNAARVGARELALIPLPATYTFDKALGVNPPYSTLPAADQANVDRVRELVYDPTLLAVDLSAYSDDASFQVFVATWPPLNRMLLPLMLREDVGGVPYLRYPGALVQAGSFGTDSTGDSLIVMVPVVTRRGAGGAEFIEWHHVVEEMRASAGDAATGPFSMIPTPPQTQQGLVALRVNFPFQAGMLTAFQASAPGDPFVNDPVLADDGAVTVDSASAGTSATLPGALVSASSEGTYSGQYGLGKQFALAKEVRPFRRSLSAQSIFRREVFK